MKRTALAAFWAAFSLSVLFGQDNTPFNNPASAAAPQALSIVPDSWSLGTPMSTARKGPFTGVVGTRIYVIGGETDSAVLNVNEIYDTTTNTWSTGAPMPTARWLGASAVVNNVLYAIGGGNAPGAAFNVVEAYDPATNTWSTKAPMPTVNDNIFAAVEDNLIYVVGGFTTSSGSRLATVLVYNPASNTWSAAAALKVAKSSSAVALVGSTIIAAGGLASSGVTSDNEGYSATTNTWQALAPAPTAVQAGCFGVSGGLMYLAGGGNSASQPLAVMQAYSLQTNSWMTGLASMPHPAVAPGSAMVGGLLYCIGGADSGAELKGNIYNYVQIYQPGGPPSISPGGIVSASAFGQFTSIAPGSWIEIYGANLSATTRGWTLADFSGINAPTSLDGVKVTIGGEQAFIDYISPGQVNALVPSDIPSGSQQITVTSPAGTSAAYSITVNAVEPGILSPPSFNVNGVAYAVAIFTDGAYALPTGAIAGVTSRPAKPGDVLTLYGVGFGPVTPAIPAGQLVQQTNMLSLPLQLSIGGVPAPVLYDGLAPDFTGLYQLNVMIPAAAPGNVALTFSLNGVSGTQTLYIALGQ